MSLQNEQSRYISVRVTNVGDTLTTITILGYRYFKLKPTRFGNRKADERGVFKLLAAHPPLPFKLDVGTEWSHTFVLTDSVETMASNGYFFGEISDTTHTNALKFAKCQLILDTPKVSDEVPGTGIHL